MNETFLRGEMNESTNEEFLRQIRTLPNDPICKPQVTALVIENKILIKIFRFRLKAYLFQLIDYII
jgi:hypothetical protein